MPVVAYTTPTMVNFTVREVDADVLKDFAREATYIPFTQSEHYAEWQRSAGRTVVCRGIYEGEKLVAYVQAIVYPLIRDKTYIYAPYGPVILNDFPELSKFLATTLKDIGKEHNAVFVRTDFTPPLDSSQAKVFTRASRATYHGPAFQPRTEWMLGLTQSEDALLGDMHKNTRYSIRTAHKREVTTEVVTENFADYFETFYELMRDTAERSNFSLHSKAYYEGIWNTLDSSYAFLSVAKHSEKVIGIDVVAMYAGTAHYIFGSSRSDERDRMPSYATQWQAIQHAKEAGCARYSFGGVSDERSVNVHWAGLTSFKKKFGGYEMRHGDFLDVVVSPLWYYLYVIRKYIQSWV